MNYSNLYDLITSIEHGTQLHIGVFFFGVKRHERMLLPSEATIHSSKYCWKMKESAVMQKKCIRCRQLAIRKAMHTGKPFYGICINGVAEYTHPIFIDGTMVGIIFIGNILDPNKGRQKILQKLSENTTPEQANALLDSMEQNISVEQCQKYGDLIASYIHMLFQFCPPSEQSAIPNPLINDLLTFIEENLNSEIHLESLAGLFHYNEKYLGRLFKQHMGCSLKIYICRRRIENAKYMLENTELPIIEIATKNGFENVTYFNRRFKEFVGITPTEFRAYRRS